MRRLLILALGLLIFMIKVRASEPGLSPQAVYRPSGPASIAGLGESFQPDLNTGMAHYAVKLVVPPGVHGHQPDLALVYNSGRSPSAFGLGWNLNLTHV